MLGDPARAQLITGTGNDGVVYTGQCRLHRVVVGKAVTSQTVTIYDSTDTSTPVAVIETDVRGDYELGVDMSTAINVVCSGGAADQAITIIWS